MYRFFMRIAIASILCAHVLQYVKAHEFEHRLDTFYEILNSNLDGGHIRKAKNHKVLPKRLRRRGSQQTKTTLPEPIPYLLDREQERKYAEIIQDLENRSGLTDYVYYEVVRMNRTGVVKDDLRKMISVLRLPGYEHLEKKVLDYYRERRAFYEKGRVGIWDYKVNNVYIDQIDPIHRPKG